MRKLSIVAIALVLAGLACSLPNPGGIQTTLGSVQRTVGAALTEIPGTIHADATNAAQTKVATSGILRGRLSYPSEFLPAERIVAFDAATMTAAAEVTTARSQGDYELTVPAGDYCVVAYTLDGKLAAGYSKAVPCGLSVDCTDHNLITVHVGERSVLDNINPQDWYAPAGAFPPMP